MLKKHKLFIGLVIAVMFTTVSVHAAPFEISVFFRDEGGGCTDCGDDEFPIESSIRLSVNRDFYELINSGRVVFNIYNLYRDDTYYELLETKNHEILRMPVFFTQDGYYFDGVRAASQVQQHLSEIGINPPIRQVPYMPEGATVNPRNDRNIYEGDSVVVYFYTPWCPFCYEISPIIDNLPEYVMINGQKSYVRLVSYNRDIAEDYEIIRRYHDMFNIAEERRLVPLVMVGFRDLFLYDEVSAGLVTALEAGEGLLTPLFTERQPLPNSNYSFIFVGSAIGITILYWILIKKKYLQ